MNEKILEIAKAIKDEGEAVAEYTKSLLLIGEDNSATTQLFEELRLDECEHIQQLTLELTKLLTGDNETTEPEKET